MARQLPKRQEAHLNLYRQGTVRDLVEASKIYTTLYNVLDRDVANRTVKTQGSHTRNLCRVRQGLDLIRALFEQFLSSKCHRELNGPPIEFHRSCSR
ncbi:ACD11 homolog protein-like isoform X2 [Punica granatum]|uniref:ACD11 homolog protein-like isoform X2 n=1 Tax=Punica granatum TaxID=22663 RepID=A0A6P8E8S5_PUNGR|nr:ACD11 homolog protein-like isoform X2 [Punica granatum]